jgi:hypothetical protein
MTPGRQDKLTARGLAASGWRAGSFTISTAAGRLEVDGIVRQPFGIDERSDDGLGGRSWVVTHLPGRSPRISVPAVALAFTDRIAALTDWAAREISATPELGEQVRKALGRVRGGFHAGRLPPGSGGCVIGSLEPSGRPHPCPAYTPLPGRLPCQV